MHVMALVRVRGPLKKLADDRAEHELEGETVVELLRRLELEHPAMTGWILDERGRIRRHINVFCQRRTGRGGHGRGVRGSGRGPARDHRRLIGVTELLVGTKKGLFVLEGKAGADFEITARAFAGEPVDYAMRDPRTGRVFATMTSPFYGPKIFYSDDAAGEWEQAEGVALPEGGDQALERIWVIAPGEADGVIYAGGDPGVLFQSADGGASFQINPGLWEEPSRPDWQPGGGGLCLHSIATWPGEPDKLAVAISASGMWLSEDGGRSWRRGNDGITPRYLPEDASEEVKSARCVHHVERAPKQPERMFMQFHGGVYRSDDAGESWTDIGDGLPSDFGFPLVLDPADADSAYVIPLVADMDRVTPEARVRVYETRDGGSSWTPRGEGLPDRDAYLTVLRQAFHRTGEGSSLELYFGATSGEVFGSGDAGATWFTAATHLAPVYSVFASG